MGSNSEDPQIPPTTITLTFSNRWDHFLARIGVKRNHHRVEPGLYALGNPTPESPVFVTANYTLSFDALRSALAGQDGYILVLDTNGINVWCAAGKGTFGTDELLNRIEVSNLSDVVSHRVLILPQLGAPGVAAHEIKKRSGFKVEYGPVLASDLSEYLKTRQATPEMRQVQFPLRDRFVLIPVEFVHMALPLLAIMAVITLLGNSASVVHNYGIPFAIIAGVVLFPILLPWLPTRDFSSKGFILGGLTTIPFILLRLLNHPYAVWWWQIGGVLALLLTMMPATAYMALNFTGSTTFTSRTGVKREMFKYIPIMAWMFGIGVVLEIVVWLV